MDRRPSDYIVVRDDRVVQRITALNADAAIAAKTEQGTLYTFVREDDYESREIDAFLAQALPS